MANAELPEECSTGSEIAFYQSVINELKSQLATVTKERDGWHKDADSHLQALCEKQSEVNGLEQQLATAQAQLKEFKEAYRNITVEEMGYTLREVEALGVNFDKEVVSDGNALHDVVMTRIKVLREAEAQRDRLRGELIVCCELIMEDYREDSPNYQRAKQLREQAQG